MISRGSASSASIPPRLADRPKPNNGSSHFWTLHKLLDAPVPDSWRPYQKEAFLLRSDVLLKLNRSEQALDDLSTVILIDPTHVGALLTRHTSTKRGYKGGSPRTILSVRACSDPSKPAISFRNSIRHRYSKCFLRLTACLARYSYGSLFDFARVPLL